MSFEGKNMKRGIEKRGKMLKTKQKRGKKKKKGERK
jgi:hypothetical protein